MLVRNPRSGALDYRIEPLDAAAVAAVAQRLRAAQPTWAARPPAERAAVLQAAADALQRHAPALEAALTRDTGRLALSRLEVQASIANARRWAAQAPALIARLVEPPRAAALPGLETAGALCPYPLVGAIAPWNFPLLLSLIDVLPALAAGCAAIVKPSEITPRFIHPLRAALAELPALDAVLSVIEGDGATGAALVGQVDYVAFTGSVATGRRVAQAAAQRLIPASLELGGKDPMIVLASADPAAAAAVALRASVANAGQACQSIERVYVEQAIAEPFLAALVAQAQAVRLNHPDIGQGELGPFIDARQAAVVARQIDDALARGARALTGGRVETLDGGLYLRPTVLVDVTPEMSVLRDETFGPVIPVTVVADADAAVALANDSEFGLSASVFAATLDEAEAVGRRLHAGAVSLNDAGLTALVWEREKTSFGASGLGPSRMGDAGLARFFRRQAMLRRRGAAPLLGPA